MRLRLVAVLVGIIFLGAQFHFCAEFQPGPCASHVCPVCTTALWAIPASAVTMPTAAALGRIEVSRWPASLLTRIPHAISPRAPPVL